MRVLRAGQPGQSAVSITELPSPIPATVYPGRRACSLQTIPRTAAAVMGAGR